MTGCSGCFNYTTTEGRVSAIAIDPTTTMNGSIVAYLGAIDGGVWKTTNCCSDMTTWTAVTDDPLISTIAIHTVAINPSDHNTIYAGASDLNFGSFSMGSPGVFSSPLMQARPGRCWVQIDLSHKTMRKLPPSALSAKSAVKNSENFLEKR